jgi:RHS repeat-associated protein
VAYTRNAQGRIQAVTLDGANIVTNRSYRGDGRLLSQTWGNGLAETRTYNGLGLLTNYTLGSIESETYTYDPAGNLTARSGSSWSLGYGYDALDRLTTDNGGSGSRSYTYDANGNRLTKTVDASPTAYTYQTNTNRLATVGGSSVTLDVEGRTTAVPSYSYAYNASGRLQTVNQGSTEVGRYAHDASGLRRTKIAGGQATVYHFDESGHLLAETTAGGAVLRVYAWADATPLAQLASGTLTYLHADHLDTPRWGTSPSGTLVWRWRSDGFGDALPEEDVDGDAVNVAVNLRFPGQYFDAESGLHYNWMRHYTSAIGRYTQTDPIGQMGGVNVFLYALNDPTNLFDPFGEVPKPRNDPYRSRNDYVYTGAYEGQPQQRRFPEPKPTSRNCEEAREVLESRRATLRRVLEMAAHGVPYDATGTIPPGGIDEEKNYAAWIRATNNPVIDWNRAEHESSHLENAAGGEIYAINQEIERLEDFIARCECTGF